MLQADVVLDCGATETAGGVEAVRILVDAVAQGFLILALKWTLWTDRGFVSPMVTWQGSLKSLVADSLGMDRTYTLEAEKRTRSCLRIMTFLSGEMSFLFMMR